MSRTKAQMIAAIADAKADFKSANYGEDVRDAMCDIADVVSEAVENQMIEVDTTLSQSGAGADAAVVGGLLRDMSASDEDLYDSTEDTAGYYLNDGGDAVALANGYYSGAIPVTAGERYTVLLRSTAVSKQWARVHAYTGGALTDWQELLYKEQVPIQGKLLAEITIPTGVTAIRLSFVSKTVTIRSVTAYHTAGTAVDTAARRQIDAVEEAAWLMHGVVSESDSPDELTEPGMYVIPNAVATAWHDTYGFPITGSICRMAVYGSNTSTSKCMQETWNEAHRFWRVYTTANGWTAWREITTADDVSGAVDELDANLYSADTDTSGYYIVDDGTVTALASGYYTALIPVTGKAVYVLRYVNAHSSQASITVRVHEYDESGDWLRMCMKEALAYGSGVRLFGVSEDATYVRVSAVSQSLSLAAVYPYAAVGTAVDAVARSMTDGLRPVYVAIGTSITRGEIHPAGEATYITDYPYPQYFGKLSNCEVYNLAQGGTGLVNRGVNGDKQNFMDVIAANEELIASADLITMEWGGNDSNIVHFGRWVEDENTHVITSDYFDYDAALEQDDPYTYMQQNATELGALNWCINRIYELNQQVTLVLITGTQYARNLTVTVDKEAGTVAYAVENVNGWRAHVKAASAQLLEATGIPTINCAQGGPMSVYNNAGDDETGYLGSDGVHPTNAGYLMNARFLAGQIGKFFRHN